MIRDPIEYQIAIHLAEEDRAERRESAIDDEAARLLAGEYSPAVLSNASEAWSEMLAEDCPEIIRAVVLANQPGATRNACATAIGEAVLDRVTAYWRNLARAKAENDVDDSCPYCYDAGCPHCEERPRDD